MTSMTFYRRPTFWLSLLAGLVYCSWPLGFVLNPAVSRHELASQLEALHQPYNWAFISTDVLTGVFLVAAGIMQLRMLHNRVLRYVVMCYMLFGILVAVAALIPLNCDPEANSCGPLIRQPLVLIHGFCSIVSVLLLLAGFIIMGVHALRYRVPKLDSAFIALATCWAVFGIGSLLDMAYHFGGNALQYFFITVCSVSIVLVIAAIEYFHAPKEKT